MVVSGMVYSHFLGFRNFSKPFLGSLLFDISGALTVSLGLLPNSNIYE